LYALDGLLSRIFAERTNSHELDSPLCAGFLVGALTAHLYHEQTQEAAALLPCSAPAFTLTSGKTLVVCKGEVMFQVEVPEGALLPDDK
jgi:hypothetical protein